MGLLKCLEGSRTYLSIIAIVLTVLAGTLDGVTVLSPEITSAIVVLLSAFAIYFRKEACLPDDGVNDKI